MERKVAIIDYGVGNVHSVSHALMFLGYRNVITRKHDDIRKAAALVLPGVGAFSQAVINLNDFCLTDVLNEEVIVKRKPIIGICLGMQVLGITSEESPGYKGLGWIAAEVNRFPHMHNLKVPHVGWNTVAVYHDSIFRNLEEEPHFYFDHSFYFNCSDLYAIAKCDYGFPFPAAIMQNNIVGVQFHPEKSQTNGLKLFRNIFRYFDI